jgi:Family of unknown function (DUF5719)
VSVRLRLLVALLAAAGVALGGTVMERELGPGTPTPVKRSREVSGAWHCPHGGGEGWRAWVALANPSARATEVRMTTWSGRTPQAIAEILQPGTHRLVEVPAEQMASATTVEYIGVPAAASTVITRPEDQGGGVAAEPCAERAGTRWYVPEGSTRRGETASLVLHNPFAADAVVDVSLVTGSRVLRPGRLKGIVLAPGRSHAVDLGRFALGEDVLTAVVAAPLGRVVAEGVTTSPGGVRATVAVPGPARRWILPGAGDQSGVLVVTAPDDRPVPIHARAQAADTESALVDLETVAAESAVGFDEGARESGVVVEADGQTPFTASRRLVAPEPSPAPEPRERRDRGRPGGRDRRRERREEEPPPPAEPSDVAATAGAPAPAEAWVVLPPVGPGGGSVVILLQNPGTRPAELEVTPLGVDGPAEAETITVRPRTTSRIDLPQPAAALVRARSGSIVASVAALGHRSYAVATGVPLG